VFGFLGPNGAGKPFTRALVVRTAAPLRSPERVFAVAGVESWRSDDTSN
jgi:hypothetical protein